MGVKEDMIFVTESYLKKKEEEKEAARLQKEKELKEIREQADKHSYVDFKKKMLDQASLMGKK